MKIKDIIAHLESVAPLPYQEDYDNSGLISGNMDWDCTGILLSLDCTEAILKEAVEKKCNLIVSHHPLIFRPIRQISFENSIGRALSFSIAKEIAIYAMHTNLDNIPSGVNAVIADKLKLVNRQILSPHKEFPNTGSGLIGDLMKPVSEMEFLGLLKEKFMTSVIRHSPLKGRPVKRVGICGGSGSFLIINALQKGADFFITADVKYHDFFNAEGKLVIADIGHFESEQFTVDLLHEEILKKFPNFAVLKSDTVTNPVNYYI